MSEKEIIGFVSGKGGVGKTTLCTNLAVELTKMGKDVTVVDADFPASNLEAHIGSKDHPVKFQDVLTGDADLEDAEIEFPQGIKAVTASKKIDRIKPPTENIGEVFDELAEKRDYILVDCPPSISDPLIDIMDGCTKLIIVTEPTQTANINAAQIIEKSKQTMTPVYGTIVNKIEFDPGKELVGREIELMTESDIIGNVPYEPLAKRALFENKTLAERYPLSPASIEFKNIVAGLEGKEYNPPRFLGLRRKIRRFFN